MWASNMICIQNNTHNHEEVYSQSNTFDDNSGGNANKTSSLELVLWTSILVKADGCLIVDFMLLCSLIMFDWRVEERDAHLLHLLRDAKIILSNNLVDLTNNLDGSRHGLHLMVLHKTIWRFHGASQQCYLMSCYGLALTHKHNMWYTNLVA